MIKCVGCGVSKHDCIEVEDYYDKETKNLVEKLKMKKVKEKWKKG